MKIFDRLSNGWKLAKQSLSVINDNRTLLLFPVFSSISLIMVLATFFGGVFFFVGDSIEAIFADEMTSNILAYVLIFAYYLINFFVITFFNSALIHCTMKILDDEPTDLMDGISYANSKMGKILSWSVLSATVGTILQAISETGRFGQIITSLIGAGWSILTFFVVPILIYEDRSVFDSVKASGSMMKKKWGESLGGNFSFGLFYLLGGVGIAAFSFFIGYLLHPAVGVITAFLGFLLMFTVLSAAKTVFIATVYNHVNGRPIGQFDEETLDSVFISK